MVQKKCFRFKTNIILDYQIYITRKVKTIILQNDIILIQSKTTNFFLTNWFKAVVHFTDLSLSKPAIQSFLVNIWRTKNVSLKQITENILVSLLCSKVRTI